MFSNNKLIEDDDDNEEEITDPLTILNKERDLHKLMMSNNKSIRPDILDRLRGSVNAKMLDLAIKAKNIRLNGVFLVFGIYRKPVNTNLHFVDDNI